MITDITVLRNRYLHELVQIWEDSVRATHLFLNDDYIKALKPVVIRGIGEIPKLYCAMDSRNEIGGFMGIDDDKLEMLFIRSSRRGQGLGKELLLHGIQMLNVKYVDVNEQNPKARGFYEHFGFSVYERSECDPMGNPFPILHLKLAEKQ